MKAYDDIIIAAMKKQNSELAAAVKNLTCIPVEERYISRIVAALGFAFGDFDSACIRLDVETLPEAELDRMAQLLQTRTIQFFILLKTFFGEEGMNELVSEAMRRATDSENPLHPSLH